jgi:hypothetical protein
MNESMSGADVLMFVIVSGLVLSGVYLVAEYTRWRRTEAGRQKKSEKMRVLYDKGLNRSR